MKRVIKANGASENYSSKKLERSVALVCKSNFADQDQAQKWAKSTTTQLETWLSDKDTITSHEIRTQAAKILHNLDKGCSYLYANQRII
jgi:transcriptional regulator NrdR family protein